MGAPAAPAREQAAWQKPRPGSLGRPTLCPRSFRVRESAPGQVYVDLVFAWLMASPIPVCCSREVELREFTGHALKTDHQLFRQLFLFHPKDAVEGAFPD